MPSLVCGWFVFGEQSVEAIDARSPHLLELIKKLLRLSDASEIGAHHALPPARFFGHELRLLQYRYVFLHGSERHRVGGGELRHGDVGDEGSAHDVAPRGIR